MIGVLPLPGQSYFKRAVQRRAKTAAASIRYVEEPHASSDSCRALRTASSTPPESAPSIASNGVDPQPPTATRVRPDGQRAIASATIGRSAGVRATQSNSTAISRGQLTAVIKYPARIEARRGRYSPKAMLWSAASFRLSCASKARSTVASVERPSATTSAPARLEELRKLSGASRRSAAARAGEHPGIFKQLLQGHSGADLEQLAAFQDAV